MRLPGIYLNLPFFKFFPIIYPWRVVTWGTVAFRHQCSALITITITIKTTTTAIIKMIIIEHSVLLTIPTMKYTDLHLDNYVVNCCTRCYNSNYHQYNQLWQIRQYDVDVQRVHILHVSQRKLHQHLLPTVTNKPKNTTIFDRRSILIDTVGQNCDNCSDFRSGRCAGNDARHFYVMPTRKV